MKYEWDEAKRLRTLRDRNLDFRDADILFRGWRFRGRRIMLQFQVSEAS